VLSVRVHGETCGPARGAGVFSQVLIGLGGGLSRSARREWWQELGEVPVFTRR